MTGQMPCHIREPQWEMLRQICYPLTFLSANFFCSFASQYLSFVHQMMADDPLVISFGQGILHRICRRMMVVCIVMRDCIFLLTHCTCKVLQHCHDALTAEHSSHQTSSTSTSNSSYGPGTEIILCLGYFGFQDILGYLAVFN